MNGETFSAVSFLIAGKSADVAKAGACVKVVANAADGFMKAPEPVVIAASGFPVFREVRYLADCCQRRTGIPLLPLAQFKGHDQEGMFELGGCRDRRLLAYRSSLYQTLKNGHANKEKGLGSSSEQVERRDCDIILS